MFPLASMANTLRTRQLKGSGCVSTAVPALRVGLDMMT